MSNGRLFAIKVAEKPLSYFLEFNVKLTCKKHTNVHMYVKGKMGKRKTVCVCYFQLTEKKTFL